MTSQQIAFSAFNLLMIYFCLYFDIVSKNIVVLFFKVDDGGDEEETNMRNGGDRGKSQRMLLVL